MGLPYVPIVGEYITCKGDCSRRYLQKTAFESLKFIAQGEKRTLNVSLTWRSAAEQHLLFQWKATGKCKIITPV